MHPGTLHAFLAAIQETMMLNETLLVLLLRSEMPLTEDLQR